MKDRAADSIRKTLTRKRLPYRLSSKNGNKEGWAFFYCRKGHEFESTINGVLYKNHKCPQCDLEENRNKIGGSLRLIRSLNTFKTEWLLECDMCGREHRRSVRQLKNGYICSCINSQTAKKIECLNERYGVYPAVDHPYKKTNTSIKWVCSNNHVFFETHQRLFDPKRRAKCRECAEKKKIEKLNKELSSESVFCISNFYTVESPMLFICLDCEREFKARADRDVKCHYCNEPEPVQQCWRIFEMLLMKPFKKTRPKWLQNPDTGSLLELDGYCEELGVAFEYQGEQHYNPVRFGGYVTDPEKQQKIDDLKLRICQDHGVDLIQVWYAPFEEMFEKIYSDLLSAGKIGINNHKKGNRNI